MVDAIASDAGGAPQRTPEEEALGACLANCKCQAAVRTAYKGMVERGLAEEMAIDIATRLYRYHHPEVESDRARVVVQVWTYDGHLH